MIKKKLLLLPLILTLILVLGISFTAAGCSCSINDPGIDNLPPVIVRLYVSSTTIKPGGEGTVTVEATDGTDEILSYKWSIQSGGGSIVDQNLPETKWVAPNNTGTFTIQVTISDQLGGVTSGVISVTVVAAAQAGQNNQGGQNNQAGQNNQGGQQGQTGVAKPADAAAAN
jgi:hypothetical protein